jgi:hypothetical protein
MCGTISSDESTGGHSRDHCNPFQILSGKTLSAIYHASHLARLAFDPLIPNPFRKPT